MASLSQRSPLGVNFAAQRTAQPRHHMLAVALRRRGAVWLAQLAPAASPTLHIGGGNRQRALCTAAQAAASQSAAADVTTDADFAEPAGKRKGRPPKKGPLLLLVESPAKARKIQEFLGPQYTVLASYGHIRDLPAKQGSVQPDDGFAMKWSVLDNAEGRLAPIVGAARTASRILLATDPDREGEAISWHLLQELQARKAIRKVTPTERITFTEVTKRAVEEALLHPRSISEPLVHAYMARRALDYLFGFHLSPLLWRKVPGAQSAGRVQSVALRLVCEREAAIAAFQQHMYYTVEAALQLPGDLAAMARVVSVDGQPPPQPGFTERKVADDVAARVAAAQFNVLEASTREQQRQPPAPFTTSTLQQEANKRLGLGASRTMQLAQRLYEAGHITYMRTDGVSLDPEAATELRQVAVAEHGAEYVPQQPRVFKSKAKNAQEAHEAIRPTSAQLTVEGLAALGAEPAATKLYGLIRGRALACQMSPARITQVAADLADENGSLRLRATASAIAFPGYLAALSDPSSSFAAGVAAEEEDAKQGGAPAEGTEEGDVGDGSAGGSPDVWLAQQEAARALAAALATFQRGQAVALCNAAVALHETRPPARFTEGSLVKQLEELGIGRPGTYAPTITVLQARGYMLKQGRALHAKALGQVLSAFLQTYFPTYVDYGFTSGLEVQLDEVAGGGASWKDVVGGFWTPFSAALGEVADVAVTDVINRLNDAVGDQLIGEDRVCPSCGGQLSFKFASRKLAAPFVGCSTYPTCKYVRNLDESWEVHDAMGALQQEGGSNPAPGTELVSHAITAIQAERAAAIAGLSGYARLLGDCPDTGLPVFVRAGLYGPYVQRGLHAEHETHFRRQALARNAAHRVVTLQMALAMLSLPKDLGVNPATGDNVLVAMGKFGAFIRCGALSRAIPKDYDPLTMTLADALQLLASKANYATARTTRKAALADAAAAESAVEAAEQTEKAAAARVVARKQKKKRVGRPSKVDIAIERAATAAAERLQASQGQAALGSHQRLEEEADLAALRLHQARTAARVALDAAAEVQVEQLQAALAMGDDVADEAERVLAAADKKRSRQKLGVNAYNLYHREVVEEAARSGDKWWGQEHAAVAIAERWKGLSAQEQQRFEAQAQEARLELDAHAAGLLAPDTPLSSLTAAQRAQLDADLAMRQLEALEGSTGAKRLKKKLLLPRPRTAYNLFTTSRQQLAKDDLGPGATGSDIMLRLAEMWRSSTVFQKAEYKGQADEEAKAYREAKTALTQQQQAATAAALAEGMDPMAAARAGLLAGQALVEEFMRQRERRARKMAAAKAVREGEAE